jgi:hypothetical protein
MRAVFGLISLLVVLAVVGILASRQLGATRAAVRASPSAPEAATPAATDVRAASRQLQERAKDDVVRALQEGAARRDAAAQ